MILVRERAISLCEEFGDRLWSLSLAITDHFDELDATPEQYSIAMATTRFNTYAEARRIFATVLIERYSPWNFIHTIIIKEYSYSLHLDVFRDLGFLQSLNEETIEDNRGAAAVAARWDSWPVVEKRWPFRVPADCSVLRKEEVELICQEMWTALRNVGEAALVRGEGKPGDAAFCFTADGYVADNRETVSGALYNLMARWVRGAVGAGKSIKQD